MTELIKVIDRRNSDSVKWGLFDKDVLPLWVADMDFVSPAAVIKALHERVDHGVFGYPMTSTRLVDLVVNRMQERYQWKITSEDVLLVPGVVSAFNLACQTVVQPGGSILTQPPVYPPILMAARNADARSVESPLIKSSDGSYEVDFDGFESSIAADTGIFLLCNPHNPVGKVFSKTELERMAEICLRHNVIICSDEIHSDLVFQENRHTPMASLSKEISQSTVTLIAPSKTYNIAGLECAVMISENHDLLKKIDHSRRGLMGWVNLLGMTAAEAAYREGDAWLAEVLRFLESNRDYVDDFIKERMPLIKTRKPEATYLTWLDCRNIPLVENPFDFFLQKARVALNNGLDFGKGGEGHVRINFACSRELLTEALCRMEKAICDL